MDEETQDLERDTAAFEELGDAVELLCRNHEQPVVGFVILAANGYIEYRSPMPIEELKASLHEAADAL